MSSDIHAAIFQRQQVQNVIQYAKNQRMFADNKKARMVCKTASLLEDLGIQRAF